MSRRVPGLVLGLVLLTAACGRLTQPAGGGTGPPAGPDDLLLRVETAGGFVPVGSSFRELPAFSLYGDGRVIRPGAQIEIYPGPALPSLFVSRLTPEGVRAVLEAAREAGLAGPDRRYDWPVVADAPTTTFTFLDGDDRHVVSVYALGFEGSADAPRPPGVTEEELAARRDLTELALKLDDLRGWLPAGAIGAEEPYEPSALRVLVQPYAGPGEPGLEQPEAAWPGGEPLARFGQPWAELPDARCGVVSGVDLGPVLRAAAGANELTPWTSGGARYLLSFRPLLPDESGC